MSELLWLYGSLDPRVRPLAFAVRHWARTVGLTNVHPGRWITNFPLTLMVLFFLQQKTKEGAILPSFKELISKADKEDTKITEDNINCTFLRDLNKLPPETYSQNNSNMETLLLEFFEFYSQFNFQEKGISIVEGEAVRKSMNHPLYIVNPLEQALNVSRNVSYEECEKLKIEIRNAAWQLESTLGGEKSEDWGLINLIEKRATRGVKKLIRAGNMQRLVSVKDLFINDDKKDVSDFRGKLQRLTNSSDNIKETAKKMENDVYKENKGQKLKFKNSQVANTVNRILRNKRL